MDHVTKNPMYRYLMVLTIASMVGLQTWRTLFNNFAVEVAFLQGKHIGVIQAVREIPGFLALLAIFVIMILREHKLSALSILILGTGVALTGFFPSYTGLLVTTLIMSFGFHYYETTNQSLTLQYFDRDTSPWVFGKLRSYGAATNVIIGIIIFIISMFLSYMQIYLLIGLVIIIASIWAFAQNPTHENVVVQRKKMVFRKKYWLFYLLTFLAGARRQIFVAFAVFLLVKNFKFSVQEITILFVVNNIVNYFLNPIIGKAIIRYGERRILSIEYSTLIVIFIAYAYIHFKIIIAVLYIIDNIVFNFAIAIRTYFQKVSDPRDIAPSMAVGFTINHIAAVVIPAIGGLLWMINYKIPFLAASAMSVVSLIAAQFIHVRRS
ncbi:MAG: MFS transporter [Calditrichaceae bacterium]|jgi:predicted MFS family arabinose efflux permease